jgi:integrase
VSGGRWNCFFYDLGPSWAEVSSQELESLGDIPAWFRANGRRDGQPVLIGPDGHPDPRIDAFFSSRRMAARSPGTNRKYAFSLRVWLDFLVARGVPWDAAREKDVEAFKFWRRTDERNPRRVQGSTWAGDVAALCALYDWAAPRFGVANPIAKHLVTWDGESREAADVGPDTVRAADVKWLTPDAYERWRDVGLLGLLPDGSERERWRPRCGTRDAAFVEGLWGTGLRLQEWASVLVLELPPDDATRRFSTCELADACAKRGLGHRYWMPRGALTAALSYVETDRAAAVRRARVEGAYERLPGTRVVVREGRGGRLVLRRGDEHESVPVGALTPTARMRLLQETPEGLEPVMLWLNEDGLPRAKRGWYRTFDGANARLARAGLGELSCSPHMLRHSFALRWYSVGRLVWEEKLSHLSVEEARDFRYQFGSTWDLVKTMLGHRDVRTTVNVYLEPFRALDVELLLEYAGEESVAHLVAASVRANPRVRTDPVGGRPAERSR